MSGSSRAAEVVDALVTEPVLVVGSLPTAGRDLDLMVGAGAESSLSIELTRQGWARRDDVYLTIREGCCHVIDLESTTRSGVPAVVVEDLFRAAERIDGFRWLMRPAAHHVLLLFARRFGRRISALSPSQRERIDRALADDPQAWARAESASSAWGLSAELAELQRFLRDGADRPSTVRRAVSRLRRPAGRGGVVAVSGVDGAGKSTQTVVVAEGLRTLGYDAAVEWTRITYDPSLERIARPVKSLLARRQRGSEAVSTAPIEDAEAAAQSPARMLRQNSRVIGAVWVTIIAVVDAVVLRRSVRAATRAGGVVVRDRYALDSVVQLLDQYGPGSRRQASLIARTAPRPRAAVLLDVPAETAFRRKPEEYDVLALTRHRDNYLRLAPDLGVTVVNGDRDADAISLELLLRAWDGLRS